MFPGTYALSFIKIRSITAKIGFEKYASSPEISAKMCQILLVWFERPILDTFFGNIFGLGAHFSKLIFALKSRVQASQFENHEPHNRNNFFFTF